MINYGGVLVTSHLTKCLTSRQMLGLNHASTLGSRNDLQLRDAPAADPRATDCATVSFRASDLLA